MYYILTGLHTPMVKTLGLQGSQKIKTCTFQERLVVRTNKEVREEQTQTSHPVRIPTLPVKLKNVLPFFFFRLRELKKPTVTSCLPYCPK